jgi:hypothetical protein
MSYEIPTVSDPHRPSEAFRDYLEEEVTRTFRRDRAARRARLAAIVFLSATLGLTGGLARAQIRESTQRDSLLEAARADAALLQLRRELLEAQLAKAQRAVTAGAALAESATALDLQLREMQAKLARAAANIEEIKASALPPRDDLNAPLVDGRDFVRDRIQYRLMALQADLQAAEASKVDADRRVRVGAASEAASLDAELAVTRAQSDLAVAAERLALRKEFLEKGTAIEQLTQRLEQMELKQNVAVAQSSLNVARQRAALLDKLHAAGSADELEALKAQLELKQREFELQALVRRLKDAARP